MQTVLRTRLYLLAVYMQVAPERLGIGRPGGVDAEQVEFFQDSLFHLGCRLLGEGDGENMPIAISLLIAEQQADVLVCECVGLSATGRCFVERDHGMLFGCLIAR